MQKEAIYVGRSNGDFKGDDGQQRVYDNEVFEIMGGRVKFPRGSVEIEGGTLIEGETCTLEYGEPQKRKAGNYVEFVAQIERVYATSLASVKS